MEKKTNGMSIAAIIFAFLMPAVGLILAIIAKKKDSNDTLAKVAFVLSLIFTILSALTVMIFMAIFIPAMIGYVDKVREYGMIILGL
ncbi:MAG: hypothetical protein IJ330_07655 [Oscillospiraceae bacterium]|nr:hypothetical protein [Oscillospiraceae bacterium]